MSKPAFFNTALFVPANNSSSCPRCHRRQHQQLHRNLKYLCWWPRRPLNFIFDRVMSCPSASSCSSRDPICLERLAPPHLEPIQQARSEERLPQHRAWPSSIWQTSPFNNPMTTLSSCRLLEESSTVPRISKTKPIHFPHVHDKNTIWRSQTDT